MAARRQIHHPGPVASVRFAKAWGEAVQLGFTVEPGESMEAGLGRGVAEAGCDAACVAIRGARLAPFQYVMPAASPGPSHAAWYSPIYAPEGAIGVRSADAIVGWRDGAPFVHCHGVWQAAGEALAMGHMLAAESVAVEPVRVTGTGLRGAVFQARQDEETNFHLFSAEAAGRTEHGKDRALAVTLRPNQDIGLAIEGICADEGIAKARIHGIGSLNGARFTSGPSMDSYASELMIRDGWLEGGRSHLDVEVVAMDGRIFEGILTRGDNPVCVTFELVIVPEA